MSLNLYDITQALKKIEDNRMLNMEILKSSLEEALIKAFKRHVQNQDVEAKVDFNEQTGQIKLYYLRNITEDVYDNSLEICLADAKKIDENAVDGGILAQEVDIDDFSRNAVVLAKNVMKQKIREAEKQSVYEKYIGKINQLVVGTIETVKDNFILINLDKTLALLPKSNQNPKDDGKLKYGQKIRVLITNVNRETKGAQILVSRSHPLFVQRLMEREIPEMAQGIIEVKRISRIAGERTKVAISSNDPNINAIGTCVGKNQTRINAVIREIYGEKIDIFEYDQDAKKLCIDALSPAKVVGVIVKENDMLTAIVEDDSLSLAIGRQGKNVKLAAKIVGRSIDIVTVSKATEEGIYPIKESVETVKKVHYNKEAREKLETIELVDDSSDGVVVELYSKNKVSELSDYDQEELNNKLYDEENEIYYDENSWIDDDIDFSEFDDFYE